MPREVRYLGQCLHFLAELGCHDQWHTGPIPPSQTPPTALFRSVCRLLHITRRTGHQQHAFLAKNISNLEIYVYKLRYSHAKCVRCQATSASMQHCVVCSRNSALCAVCNMFPFIFFYQNSISAAPNNYFLACFHAFILANQNEKRERERKKKRSRKANISNAFHTEFVHTAVDGISNALVFFLSLCGHFFFHTSVSGRIKKMLGM